MTLATLGVSALVAVPAAAAPKAAIPSDNLIANPSFKLSVAGWEGASAEIVRIRDVRAPHGRQAARVQAFPGAAVHAIEDADATVSGQVAGTTYAAAAWVKGVGSSIGKPVSLVVRELDAGATVVDTTTATSTLRRRFTRISAEHVARESGGSIEVALDRSVDVGRRERFVVDAITLEALPGEETPPITDPTPPSTPPVGGPNPPPKPIPPTGPAPITASQIAIVSDHERQLLEETGTEYRYIIVRDNMHDRLADLRAAHPESELILYKNVAFTQVEPGTGCPWGPFQGGGLSYCAADPNEDWFLHEKGTGQRLASAGYSAQRAMNVGNAAYRDAWLDAVIARLSDADNDGSGVRYDGIWLDDTNMFPSHGMDGRIAELTDAAYRAEMVEFIDQIANSFDAAGFTTIANLAANPWEPAERAASLEVAADVDVVNREGWVRWGDGALFAEDGQAPIWGYEVSFAEDIQRAGADLHALTYGDVADTNAQLYGRATFLMAWDGQAGSAFNYRTLGPGATTWTDSWTADVGRPISARYPVGIGWRRDFTDGTVVINARASGSQTFALGDSYKASDGSCVTSITLTSRQAAVLPAC